MNQNPAGNPACAPCNRFWVGTRSASVSCPAGSVGAGVTVTRSIRSNFSQEHAEQLAYAAALAEAQRELVCIWEETACVQPNCGGMVYDAVCETAESTTSAADAYAKALQAANLAATAFCS